MAVVEERLQAAAFDEFHDDVVQTVFFARIENHDDVGVGQEACGAGFGLKSSEKLRTGQAGALGAEFNSFDRDSAADNRVSGLVNDTHSAAAEFADNFVTSGLRKRRHRYVRHGRETPFSFSWQCVARRQLPTGEAAHTDTPYFDSTGLILSRST